MPLEIDLNNEQQVQVRVSPKTHKGKNAPLDGAAVFKSLDGDVEIEMLDDTTAILKTPAEFAGDRTINVSADADTGAGVVTIEDNIVLHISNPLAVNLGLAADAPTDKPE